MSKYSLFEAALSEALGQSGLTASALAEKIAIHRSRISDFADGGSLPKDETLVAICKALPPVNATKVAQAWVRERLGSALSDTILSSGMESGAGSDIEKLYSSLPTAAAAAFRLLMELSREDPDLRQSIISLAAFAEPDAPFQVTQLLGPDTPTPQSPSAQEISEPQNASTVVSPATTSVSPKAKPTAKIVKLRTHIMPESEQKVAEDPRPYSIKKKNGTED